MRQYLPGLFSFLLLMVFNVSKAQLNIDPAGSAQELAQKLVGEGISISNVSFTGDASMLMAGHFKNQGGTNINLDSGIVLTTGYAKTTLVSPVSYGVNAPATNLASKSWSLSGDPTLSAAVGIPLTDMFDACVLEFDFVPLGDTVRFRYVFSSEEYTSAFVCSYNDAFGFFISGPGITGNRNIALVPGTTLPVSILNVNNVAPYSCPNNTGYYVTNTTNPFFSHQGHTTVLTAQSAVQPCLTYHLKIVISDNVDGVWDSGVFLEAKSLSSNAVSLINNTQTTTQGEDYLVEGCIPGSFTIRRGIAAPFPLVVNLQYSGTATNGVDVQLMPTTVIIPANQTDVVVNILPIIDNIPEGIEYIKVYSLASCASANTIPIDSTVFQIRDYDVLGVSPDTASICRNSSVQLTASNGYNTYQWSPVAGLSDPTSQNPMATPVTATATYIATASIGTCNARDSAFIRWKVPQLVSSQGVNCQGANTGQVVVTTSNDWIAPVNYSIDNGINQATGTFNNLYSGNHTVFVRDGAGCLDSLAVSVPQLFPDLVIANTSVTPGSCLGGSNGSITITAAGGNGSYQYALNNGAFQSGNVFNVPSGTYSVTIKDGNGCTKTLPGLYVDFVNTVQVSTPVDPVICESLSTPLEIITNAQSVIWSPAATLDNPISFSPVARPLVSTKYYVTATTGICSRTDSVMVSVNLAPRPDAGADVSICFGGNTFLNATGAVTYNWRPSTFLSSTDVASPEVRRPTVPITYYLKVTDANGCRSLYEDTVQLNVTPAVQMFAGKDTIVAMGQPVQLHGVQIGQSTVSAYSWSPAYGLNNPSVSNPIAILDRDMTYTLTGRTPINCEGSAVINIKVYKGPEIYVPTVFTPNNDGRNDILRAWAIGMKEYRYFQVFNRWGAKVFATSDFNRGWDGKVNGMLQNTGTFVWMAEAVDFRGNVITRKGTVTIIK